MAERRVSMPSGRFDSLVIAASKVGCTCAAPEYRQHEGKCISCWALAKRIAHIRALISSPLVTPTRSLPMILAECEEEQRFRAEQRPAAERRLAQARKEEERANGL